MVTRKESGTFSRFLQNHIYTGFFTQKHQTNPWPPPFFPLSLFTPRDISFFFSSLNHKLPFSLPFLAVTSFHSSHATPSSLRLSSKSSATTSFLAKNPFVPKTSFTFLQASTTKNYDISFSPCRHIFLPTRDDILRPRIHCSATVLAPLSSIFLG